VKDARKTTHFPLSIATFAKSFNQGSCKYPKKINLLGKQMVIFRKMKADQEESCSSAFHPLGGGSKSQILTVESIHCN
jgi:hypothetical protein